MTQTDKQLLLKDICARLPYGVKCTHKAYPNSIKTIATVYPNETAIVGVIEVYLNDINIYLRPMSSMTEEEKKEYDETFDCIVSTRGVEINHERRPTYETYDWLNEHYFDYRELIEKGLALQAPKGMYNIK